MKTMDAGQTKDRISPSLRRGPNGLSERELVDAVLRKDRKATAEFIVRCADEVYGYVKRRLAPRIDLIEDTVQDVFLAAWASLASFQGGSPLRIWLLGIARHKIEDHYRKRFREIELLAVDERVIANTESLADPVDELSSHESRRKTQEILAQMPEMYAWVLKWRYWQECSVRQMAVEACKSEKAVERLLARARIDFMKRWNERLSAK